MKFDDQAMNIEWLWRNREGERERGSETNLNHLMKMLTKNMYALHKHEILKY